MKLKLLFEKMLGFSLILFLMIFAGLSAFANQGAIGNEHKGQTDTRGKAGPNCTCL